MSSLKLHKILALVWTQSSYTNKSLTTQTGETVRVIAPGRANPDAHGIEILDAQVEINAKILSGNIAVHEKASHWRTHLHQLDMSYDACILHVVCAADAVMCRVNGEVIPTLALEIPTSILEKYQNMIRLGSSFRCAQTLAAMNPVNRYHLLTRLMVERLERKHNDFLDIYKSSENNWNEVFYVMLFRAMGRGSRNTEAYMTLAQRAKYSYLCRLKHDPVLVEALLLGTAGLLDTDRRDRFADPYTARLQEEFAAISQRFAIMPMRAQAWEVAKSNPRNHPIIRIVQLAALLTSRDLFFESIVNCRSISELHHLLGAEASEYWSTHFTPSSEILPREPKSIGTDTLNSLCINLVAPLFFTYGKINQLEEVQERSLEILENLPCERNLYMKDWSHWGISIENAFFSQALLQLSKEYCEKKVCTGCDIGKIILCGRE